MAVANANVVDSKLANSEDTAEQSKGTELSPTLLEKLFTTTIQKEIAELRTEFLAKLHKSQSALNTTIEHHETRISAESTLTDVSSNLQQAERQCAFLSTENQFLRQKTDDLENNSRRMNLRVIGIPEGVEQGRPTDFMSSFFTTLFGEGNLSRNPVIERNRRSLNPKASPHNQPPRATIVHFHD